jgi:hypothetical protein
MPEKKTTQRARRDRSQGKKATTQAGNYVGEEMRHKKSGKHPVKSRRQAVAIGLSKARRAGVKVPSKKSTGAKSGAAKRAKTRSPKATRTRAKSTRKSAASGHTRRKGSSTTKRSGSASKSRSSRSKSRKS